MVVRVLPPFTSADLKALRQLRGLSQASLAAVLGMTPARVCQLERSTRPLSPELQLRLARVFFG